RVVGGRPGGGWPGRKLADHARDYPGGDSLRDEMRRCLLRSPPRPASTDTTRLGFCAALRPLPTCGGQPCVDDRTWYRTTLRSRCDGSPTHVKWFVFPANLGRFWRLLRLFLRDHNGWQQFHREVARCPSSATCTEQATFHCLASPSSTTSAGPLRGTPGARPWSCPTRTTGPPTDSWSSSARTSRRA